MTIERHPIVDEEEWLRWRTKDVTASVAAALLDAHERHTKLQLYLDKSGVVPLHDQASAAMRRGQILEPVAVELLRAARPEWQIVAPRLYVRDPERRIGATPDVYVLDKEKRLGLVEIKSVEPSRFERTWRDGDQISPPIAAAIQAIVCKHLCGADWCAVGVIRVGHAVDFDLVPIEEPDGLWDRLTQAAAEFWQAVADRKPPEPDFGRDADLLLRLYRDAEPESTVDLTGNNRVLTMQAQDEEYSAKEKSACEARRALKAELLHMMGKAEVALYNGRQIATARSVTRKAYQAKETTFRDVRWKGKPS